MRVMVCRVVAAAVAECLLIIVCLHWFVESNGLHVSSVAAVEKVLSSQHSFQRPSYALGSSALSSCAGVSLLFA